MQRRAKKAKRVKKGGKKKKKEKRNKENYHDMRAGRRASPEGTKSALPHYKYQVRPGTSMRIIYLLPGTAVLSIRILYTPSSHV